MEKLMVIGGSGLLGGHLVNFAKNEYDVISTFNGHNVEIEGVRNIQMDITQFDRTQNQIEKEKPELVILCAAQRNVDYCEKNQEEVWRINVQGAKNVASASKKVQAHLVYLSTDLVFDGEKETYLEEDEPNPINYYGRTKLEGEREVMNTMESAAVARVSVLYDWNLFPYTFNFVSWVHRELSEGKKLSLFLDQARNATYIQNACEAIMAIHERDQRGIFHIVGRHCQSRHEIGLDIAEVFGFDKDLISTSTSEESDWVAKRPKRCCLSWEKMQKELGISPISMKEGLLAMKTQVE